MNKLNYYSTLLFLGVVAVCTIYDISNHHWKLLIWDIVFGVIFSGIAVFERKQLKAEEKSKNL